MDTDKFGKYAVFAETETDPAMLKKYRDYKKQCDKVSKIWYKRNRLIEQESMYREVYLAQVNTVRQAEIQLKKIHRVRHKIIITYKHYEIENRMLRDMEEDIKKSKGVYRPT